VIGRSRAIAARHEFRLGNRELIAFAGVVVLICALTFLFGILVGREMTPAPRLTARSDRDRLEGSGTGAKAVPTKGDDHLTFYKTLTAPTADVPPRGKPTIEERLVPGDESTAPAPPSMAPAATPGTKASSAAEVNPSAPVTATPGAPASARRPAAATGGSSRPAVSRSAIQAPRPASRVVAAAPVTSPGASAATPASPQVAGASPAEPTQWTVQVSSFRSRPLAEELRSRLAARGLEAYLLPSAEGGQVRYRVRVGSYPSRGDAERLAVELGSERTLTPFVTPRTR
jgi:cell division protein FtsN